MKKRILSLVLVLTMVVSLMPGMTMVSSAAGSTLPAGYIELQYIATDADAYFDTGIEAAEDIRLEYSFSVDAWNADKYECAVGARGVNWNDSSISLAAINGRTAVSFGNTAENSTDAKYYDVSPNPPALSLGTIYEIEQDKDGFSINGDEYGYASEQTLTFANPHNIYVGGRNNNGTAETNFIGKIYGVKIYKDDVLVRDYVPANNGSNNGMYDLINDTFEESDTDAEFTGALAPVEASVESGYYAEEQLVSLTSSEGAPIYYTTDGSMPTTASTLYTQPFYTTDYTVLKAIAECGGVESPVLTKFYYSLPEGYSYIPSVATDGDAWFDSGVATGEDIRLEYSFSVDQWKGNTYECAVGARHANDASSVSLDFINSKTVAQFGEASEIYPMVLSLETPYTVIQDKNACSINGVSYSYKNTQTLNFANPHNIYVGGRNISDTDVTKFFGKLYNVAIYEDDALVRCYVPAVNVSAGEAGMYDLVNGTFEESDTGISFTFTVSPVTASVTSGNYAGAQSVVLTAGDPGDAIYYTTDGSKPTKASTLYTEAVSVTEDTCLKAIAVNTDGIISSDIMTEKYVIASLPEGYSLLQSVHTNGLSYIDTGISASEDILVEYGFSVDNYTLSKVNRQVALGTRGNSYKDSCISLTLEPSVTSAYFGSTTQSYTGIKTALATGIRYDVRQDKDSLIINGVEHDDDPSNYTMDTTRTTTFPHANTLYIGARNAMGTNEYSLKGDIYYADIYDDGDLVRSYVPAEKDGVIGLYDRVNGTFRESEGYRPFTSDKSATYIDAKYVQIKDSYIDTGIEAAEDIRLEYSFSVDAWNADKYECAVGARGVNWNDSAISLAAINGRTAVSFGNTAENSTDAKNYDVSPNPPALSLGTIYEIEQDKDGFSINGDEYGYPSEQTLTFANPHNIYVGGRNNNGTAETNFIGRIYGVKIYKNDVLVRDLVPKYDTQNEEYLLYDEVEQKAYRNKKFSGSVDETYTEIEYVRVLNSYIDTGVATGEDIRLEYTFSIDQWKDNTYECAVGARHANDASSVSLGFINSRTAAQFGEASEIYPMVLLLKIPYTVVQDKNVCTINGVSYSYKNTQTLTFANPHNIYVGGRNINETADTNFIGKIYGVKIYDNDVLIRNYVPVRGDDSGEVAFHETINDTICKSIGNLPFTAQPMTDREETIHAIMQLLSSNTDYTYSKEVYSMLNSGYFNGYTDEELQDFAEELTQAIDDDDFISCEHNRVFINTDEAWNPTGNTEYVDAQLTVAGTDGSVYSDASGKVKVRGNSTATGAKKPYNIKFSSKQNLFGMGNDKKWSLLADCYDPSLMRNNVALSLAESLDLAYTSKRTVVEVWVNGSYNGCYLLAEPVDTGSDRVDIDVDNGDFLIERGNLVEEGVTYVKSHANRFEFKDPDEPTVPQLTAVQNYLDNVYTTIEGGVEEDIRALIDVDSFARYYLLLEFTKPVDAGKRSENYYVKDGVMYAGPAWDFDGSAGDNLDLYGGYYAADGAENGSDTLYANKNYFAQLLAYDWFSDLVKDLFVEYRDSFRNVFKEDGMIDTFLDENGELYTLNYTPVSNGGAGWDVSKKMFSNRKQPLATFEANVEYLRTYYSDRYDWLTETWDTEDKYSVKFVTGKDLTFPTQIVEENGYVTNLELKDPKTNTTAIWYTKDGTDGDWGEEWGYWDAVTEDIVLYAQWKTLAKATIGDDEYDSLADAIDDAENGDTIKLASDIMFENVTIPAGLTVTLDLNGFLLTYEDGDIINNYGNLTITGDGTVEGMVGAAIVNYPDATVTINSGTIKGSGVYYAIKNMGSMTITGGTVTANAYNTASLIDNGWVGNAASDRNVAPQENKASLTISSGNFISGAASCHVVRNDDYGTLVISGGSFDSTANTGTVDAATIFNWNVATISGGTFTGSYPISNGYLAGGADQGLVTITGGTFTGSECLFGENIGAADGGSITITDGNFEDTTTLGTPDAYDVVISGGTFGADPTEFLAPGYSATENGGIYTVARGAQYIDINGVVHFLDESGVILAGTRNSVTLDNYSANKAADLESLSITLNGGIFVLNEAALDNIAASAGTDGTVTLTIYTLSGTQIMEGMKASYDLFLTDENGEAIAFNDNGGSINVTIPYTREAADKTVVVYYTPDSGNNVNMNAAYSDANHKVSFDTNHFSNFSINEEDWGYTTALAKVDDGKTGYNYNDTFAVTLTVGHENSQITTWRGGEFTLTYDKDNLEFVKASSSSSVGTLAVDYVDKNGTLSVFAAPVANSGTSGEGFTDTITLTFKDKNSTITSSTTTDVELKTAEISSSASSVGGDNETARISGSPVTVTLLPSDYTITYYVDGKIDSTLEPASYTYGIGATLATPTKTGHDFGGWYDNEECSGTAVTSIGATESGDKTYYGKFTPSEYTITYVLNDGTNDPLNPENYTYGIGVTKFKDATKTGYDFGGWYDNAQFTGDAVTTIGTTETGAKTLYAKFTPHEYTLTTKYIYADGTSAADDTTSKVAYGASIADATLAHHTFLRWQGDVSTMPAANTEVTAVVAFSDYTVAAVPYVIYDSSLNKTMYRITVTLGKDAALKNGTAFFYDNEKDAMFVNADGTYSWLIAAPNTGDGSFTNVEALAQYVVNKLSVKAGTAQTYNDPKTDTGKYNVNMSSKVDVSDAVLAYDISSGVYKDFSTVIMAKFLNANLPKPDDNQVTVLDAQAVVSYIIKTRSGN